jgi:hypothetical protein
MNMDWRKARMFLELRQADVANATGLTIQRLSMAERGMAVLNRVEQASLELFLRARLREEFAQMSGLLSRSNDSSDSAPAPGPLFEESNR